MAVYHARAKVFADLSKEEGDYDEPDDVICEGTEGLTERECLLVKTAAVTDKKAPAPTGRGSNTSPAPHKSC